LPDANNVAALTWMCQNWLPSLWASTTAGDQLTGGCASAAAVCTCVGYPCSNWPYILCSDGSTITELNFTGSHVYGADGTSDPYIDPIIGNLNHLTTIAVGDNYFRSPLPDSIGNITTLTFFDWSYNFINGTLPATFSKLVNLKTFDVHSNSIYGTIPASWSALISLQYFDIDGNSVWGTLPTFTAPNIYYLNFGGQSLYGTNTDSISSNWPGQWLANSVANSSATVPGFGVYFYSGYSDICCSTTALTVGGYDLTSAGGNCITTGCPAVVAAVPDPGCCCGACGGSSQPPATPTGGSNPNPPTSSSVTPPSPVTTGNPTPAMTLSATAVGVSSFALLAAALFGMLRA